jgi:GTP:adenosylcobinamide-phosphate guanylyltransferase
MLYIMLAGGKSKRLGFNKLLISVCGLPLVWVSFIKYKSLGFDLKVAVSKHTSNEVIFLKFLGAEIIELQEKVIRRTSDICSSSIKNQSFYLALIPSI